MVYKQLKYLTKRAADNYSGTQRRELPSKQIN